MISKRKNGWEREINDFFGRLKGSKDSFWVEEKLFEERI